jgi:predicted Zn-dependent peptidase
MIKLPKPRRIALDSGAVLLYQRNIISPTAAFGVWIRKGSRDEKDNERGMSHVLEHMVFRGTPSRSGIDIALELESIGGQWDAFTGKEAVCFHGRTLDEHLPRMVVVFSDILLNPMIDARALRTELKVVREEIRSVSDSPEETAYELFFRGLFGGGRLGRPVAGSLGDISRIDREGLISFHRKTYTAANSVFAYTGTLPPARVARLVDENFSFPLKGRSPGRARENFLPASSKSSLRRGWSQFHVCIGARGLPAGDPMRFAMMILSGAIGGGVSSRLFQSLREKAGLAYSLYSHVNFWSDTGAFSVYFSVDQKNLEPAIDIFEREMDSIRRNGLTDEEMESARAQLEGSMILGLESSETRLFRLFNGECYLGGFRKIEDVLRDIREVDASMISLAVERVLSPEKMISVICGPRVVRKRRSYR